MIATAIVYLGEKMLKWVGRLTSLSARISERLIVNNCLKKIVVLEHTNAPVYAFYRLKVLVWPEYFSCSIRSHRVATSEDMAAGPFIISSSIQEARGLNRDCSDSVRLRSPSHSRI